MKCRSNDESQICKKTRNNFENSWEFQQEQKNYKYSWWFFFRKSVACQLLRQKTITI